MAARLPPRYPGTEPVSLRVASHSAATLAAMSDATDPLPRPDWAVPDKPGLEGLEDRWAQRWIDEGTYAFDRTKARDEVYSIDTPPPTVSGSLHVGHMFSFTHTDLVARYQRMSGREVFYPMGWDDNGLPTERRVQNYYNVTCDPSLPHDPDFAAPPPPEDRPKKSPPAAPISRPNFVDLCEALTEVDEQAFEDLFRVLGLSVDWSLKYTTIDERSRKVAQLGFLHNLARGEAYQAEAPVLWDVDFRSAVAQAELEDRDVAGAYHRIGFPRSGDSGSLGEPVFIETTRPELIPACVALVAHPDDARYQPLFGQSVRTPLFGVEVPVLAHELAEPDKGSGIAMICTFGDITDVTWWRELRLPTRSIVGPNGRLLADPPDAVTLSEGRAAYAELAGKTVKQAQVRIVELLRESGDLDGEPKPITHPVKFYEKGDRPLEIVTSRQWYIRNGGRDDELRQAMLGRADELVWHPPYMQVRLENWVNGLNGDWLISRQRFFGVPFPVWYPLDADGQPDHDHPIAAAADTLPVDPASQVPPGFDESQRGDPGGFAADPDVMDTWATSSLSPEIVTGWGTDDDLFARTFPMDLRPQAHEIIRTWLFSTALRSHLEFQSLPWSNVAISGWVLDPDRKKMSKSQGNVVTPRPMIDQFGADAVRYWAASGRPGTDTAFDEGQMKVGRRLAIKLLNASRFALSQGGGPVDPGMISTAMDRSMLAELAALVGEATRAFEAYDYARALERTEAFFWRFCDQYLELVKGRAYESQGEELAMSARAALQLALSVLLRLLAPFLPFVTEEVWSWWQSGSVHRAPWPDAASLAARAGDGDPLVLTVAADVLAEVRRAKTEAKRSLRTEVHLVNACQTQDRIQALAHALADVRDAGAVHRIELGEVDPGDEFIEVELVHE
jgi:valyl-tRNA synthetase